MGTGDHPVLNPPPLDRDDARALRFYTDNATAFVQEFGLMPGLVERLGLPEEVRRVFLAKLGRIHETVLKMRAEELRKQRG